MKEKDASNRQQVWFYLDHKVVEALDNYVTKSNGKFRHRSHLLEMLVLEGFNLRKVRC